jgi:predicted nucleotidyltransferase
MDRNDMMGALQELSDELQQRKVDARIYLVGGAVMVLAFNTRFSTDDVDASVYPPEEVLAVAADIADRRGLARGWLNDSAKIFVPLHKEPDWRPVVKVGTVEIVAADERTMLAMKMRASRGRRDEEDIEFLLGKCHIGSETEALELYEEYFPEDPLPQRSQPILRRALSRLGKVPEDN